MEKQEQILKIEKDLKIEKELQNKRQKMKDRKAKIEGIAILLLFVIFVTVFVLINK